MAGVSRLKRYLKKTERLLTLRDTKVPRKKVDLSVVSFGEGPNSHPVTLKQMMACGSVGCLAGWANAFERKPVKQGRRIGAMEQIYGVRELPWRGKKNEELFAPSAHALQSSIADWREARRRLVSRIKQLKRKIATEGGRA